MTRPFYTLTRDDVGKISIHAFGKVWPVVNFIGRVMSRDAGKRVYQVGDVLQVENDQQRTARIAGMGNMKRKDPTRHERERVHFAWRLLEDATDRMPHGNTARAYAALSVEKKGRGNATIAKALIVEAFIDGYTRGHEVPFAAFTDVSGGLLWAAALGAEAYKRRDRLALHPHMMALAYECQVFLDHVRPAAEKVA
jgi:hypothetical protein